MNKMIFTVLLCSANAFAFSARKNFKGEIGIRNTDGKGVILSEYSCQLSETQMELSQTTFSLLLKQGICQNVLGGDIGFESDVFLDLKTDLLGNILSENGQTVGEIYQNSVEYHQSLDSDLKSLRLVQDGAKRLTLSYSREFQNGDKLEMSGRFQR